MMIYLFTVRGFYSIQHFFVKDNIAYCVVYDKVVTNPSVCDKKYYVFAYIEHRVHVTEKFDYNLPTHKEWNVVNEDDVYIFDIIKNEIFKKIINKI